MVEMSPAFGTLPIILIISKAELILQIRTAVGAFWSLIFLNYCVRVRTIAMMEMNSTLGTFPILLIVIITELIF